MADIGSVIVDSVFKFNNSNFDWNLLFNFIKGFSLANFINLIAGLASPKNAINGLL